MILAEEGEELGGQPTLDDVAAFDEEMQHELMGSERPGIRSRFKHDLSAFQNTRIQLDVSALHQTAVKSQGVYKFLNSTRDVFGNK